jgi:mannose-6-phosphate isomerase
MFDYVVVVVGEEREVRKLELSPPSKDVLRNSTFVPVSESGWNGAAGNGLGTLFAIENASAAIRKKIGKDLVAEVKQGKSALIVHTAGKGTRNLLSRTCKNKALIKVPKHTLLDGVIKQFQDFAIPSRIMVTWGDQFLLFVDSAEEIRECAQTTRVMLFGLKTTLTEEVARNYGIQIVQCTGGVGCELLDFDDTRNYEVAKRKLRRREGSEVMVNMGMFAMSGVIAERMLEAFYDNLKIREGKFNSDELWQLWISPESEVEAEVEENYWLRERAEIIKNEVAEPLALIKSFPLSAKTVWQDYGTNGSYYENMMRILDPDDVGQRMRDFLGVLVSSERNGCNILDSVHETVEFENGLVKSSVLLNSTAKHAQLEHACVINSKLNRIQGKRCVIYNVVDYEAIEVEDCFLADVFHPSKGRIRLKMRFGEEKGAKEKWWSARLPGNDFSLSEIVDMMKEVSEDEMQETMLRFERLVEAKISNADELKKVIERPIHITSFVENKPWGYELWCASPRNYCEFELGGEMQEFTLDELTFLFSEEMLGVNVAQFPLIVKIIKADENLSVQTHPDDAYARQLGDAFGKEEVWHVLKASNDAKIYLGFKVLMTPESFNDAVTSEQFLSHLNTFDAHVGDTYHIPAGVIHALGAGTKVYEGSTASERTFRVYDYGRGRELHLDDALNVLRFDEDGKSLKKVSNILRTEEGYEVRQLLKGEQLDLRLFTVHGRGNVVIGACLLTCLQGQVTLKSNSVEVLLAPTDTVLVPACIENLEMEGEGEIVCANFIFIISH